MRQSACISYSRSAAEHSNESPAAAPSEQIHFIFVTRLVLTLSLGNHRWSPNKSRVSIEFQLHRGAQINTRSRLSEPTRCINWLINAFSNPLAELGKFAVESTLYVHNILSSSPRFTSLLSDPIAGQFNYGHRLFMGSLFNSLPIRRFRLCGWR